MVTMIKKKNRFHCQELIVGSVPFATKRFRTYCTHVLKDSGQERTKSIKRFKTPILVCQAQRAERIRCILLNLLQQALAHFTSEGLYLAILHRNVRAQAQDNLTCALGVQAVAVLRCLGFRDRANWLLMSRTLMRRSLKMRFIAFRMALRRVTRKSFREQLLPLLRHPHAKPPIYIRVLTTTDILFLAEEKGNILGRTLLTRIS